MQTKHLRNSFLIIFAILFSTYFVSAQTETQNETLRLLTKTLEQKYKENRVSLEKLAKKKDWPLKMKVNNGGYAILTDVYANGLPEYTTTDDNIIAAATISTNKLWSGGELGLNLDGSTAALKDRLAIWDGGKLRDTHVELGTNRIVFKDAASIVDDHATHVAGTMIAKGINPVAKGMSFNAQNLIAYDFSNDVTEMAAEASRLLVSNHSYGSIAGWYRNTSQSNRWEFWGEFNANEDFKFGYYDNKAKLFDSLAFLAPNYLIVKSAGNKRSENGPAEGSNYWRYNASGVLFDAGQRPSGISSNNSYDILPTFANAKNILVVGAVNPISTGYQKKEDVVMSSFSSWGPTDDGRIKPDIVANGVNVTSSTSTGDNSYATLNGTSMASPNASGSVFLLQEHFNKLTGGNFMRSATLRGLIIHTADEAGFAQGPDYEYGWGLMNMSKAAKVISERNTIHRILENNLTQGNNFTLNTVASGIGPLIATICWTDPPGIVDADNKLNNRTPKLINDLDIEITQGTNTVLPWKLDGSAPTAPATRGNNILDNVERVEIDNPIPGETYTLKVTHKGTLLNNAQAYSVILSGVGGSTYCLSGPSTNADSRIDNFKFGGIDNTPAAACRQYSNFTNLIASVYPGQKLPLSFTLGTCGLNKDKIAKVYIDWNGDGNFSGANELVATSIIINATGTYTVDIIVPQNVQLGISSRIRIVCMETTDPNLINACGTYITGGETQDYLIRYTRTPIDVQAVALITPDNLTCAADSIHFSVQVKNIGNNPVLNIPVSLIIKNGTTTVATLVDTVKQLLISESSIVVNFSKQFNALPGINYQIIAFTSLSTDQDKTNDTIYTSRTFQQGSTAVLTNAKAQICSPTEVNLSVSTTSGTAFWYDSPTSTSPLGSGNNILTNILPTNKTYYIGINDATGRIGPASKSTYPSGSFSNFSPIVNFETFAPLVIESARFFNGNSGKMTIKVNNAINGSFITSATLDIIGNASNDEGTVLPLNLRIPTAGNYTFTFTFENGATSFRHNGASNNVPYPFILPGLMWISGNNQNPATNFYYYLYDLKVKSLDCPKPLPRLSVVAADAVPTPVISQNGSLLTSSVSVGNIQWLLNNANINGANSSTLVIKEAGTYNVQISKDGCIKTSAEFYAFITSVTQLNPNDINLAVSNNPGNGIYNIMFNVNKREKVLIEVSNITGQIISREEFVAPSTGSVQKTVDINGKSSGIYLMKIYFDNKQYTHKLVVE